MKFRPAILAILCTFSITALATFYKCCSNVIRSLASLAAELLASAMMCKNGTNISYFCMKNDVTCDVIYDVTKVPTIFLT